MSSGIGYGTLSFVGRSGELDELRTGIHEALGGRGAVWLLSGEPGIGKSRLAEEVARSVDGATILWGRCQEAGGAPAYWPWIQILRGLLRLDPALADDDRIAELSGLLPDVWRKHAAEPPPMTPEQARFRLMDTVTGFLFDAASRAPLLLLLDDLHAADSSSLLLLDFLVRQLHSAPVGVIGTFREAEAQRSRTGAQLLRIAQEARTLALRCLRRDEIALFLEHALGATPQPHLLDTVVTRTEGNPLFLVELTRLLVAQGDFDHPDPDRALAVPGSVRTAIRERIAAVSRRARAAIELASVVGREVRVETLVDAFGGTCDDMVEALREASRAALLVPLGQGSYRFSHILVREVVHEDVDEARRRDLHHALADALRRAPVPESDRPWSEIAHHFYAAGDRGLAPALEASERAARAALDQLAFDEAVHAYTTAIDALGHSSDAPRVRRAELLLGLGHAQLRGGAIDAGRASCHAAAELARELGDADLFARAALELGQVFHFVHVDPDLVDLLEEALDRLDRNDSSLRARVMARLAAATLPSPDPRAALDLARRAIAMARRVNEEATLLAALRAGCSCMMDLVDPRERIELNREHLELAERRRDRVDALRAHTRLAFDQYELGDPAGARAAIAAVRRLVDELDHAYYRWRATSFDALEALWEGRFADAEEAITRTVELAERSGDPNVEVTTLHQRMQLMSLRGDADGLRTLAPELERMFDSTRSGQALARVMGARCLLAAGHTEEARQRVTPDVIEMTLTDRVALLPLAELATASGDRELAGALADRLAPLGDQMLSCGVAGMFWFGPAARARGLVAAVLDRPDEARRELERAVELSRRAGSLPAQALDECGLGEVLARSGDARAARPHLDEAGRIAAELGMPGVRARLDAVSAAPRRRDASVQVAPAPVAHFQMHAEGDTWRIDCDGDSFHVKDVKGLQLLARLVECPGREVHVLDLSNPERGSGPVDTGDAGEVLDDEARAEYRSRVRELRAELEQAEEWNDTARAERARAELEFLQRELARAVGLGGRARRSGAAAERARVNVQRRLRDAIRRIGDHHEALGRHLSRSVLTGSFCSYAPE